MPAESGKVQCAIRLCGQRCGHSPGLEQGVHLTGDASMRCRMQFCESSGSLLRRESWHGSEGLRVSTGGALSLPARLTSGRSPNRG